MGMEFNAPRRILTGEGCLADAEKYFCSMGKKAFIVTGKHVKKLECFTQVMGFLDKMAYSILCTAELQRAGR